MLISPQKDSVAAAESIRDDGRGKRSAAARTGRFALQFLLMLAVLAGSYVAMSRLIDARPERAPRVVQPTVYAVAASDVVVADHRPDILAYGDVMAQRSVDLRAQVTGEIVEVNPDLQPGRRVEAGAFLARIDPFA